MNTIHSYPASIVERTAKVMKLAFARYLATDESIDITVDQWVVLQVLHDNHEISQAKICEITRKDAPTVTKIIDLLSNKGYVEKARSNKDRRQHLVTLTNDGKSLIQYIFPSVMKYREEIYCGLNQSDLEQLQKTLLQIENNIINSKLI